MCSTNDCFADPVAEDKVSQVPQHNAADYAPANAADPADYLRPQNPLYCFAGTHYILGHNFLTKLKRPLGSGKKGNLLGASLPFPFFLLSAICCGNISIEIKT